MFDFIKWFNETNDLDSLVKASIAHLWFVTIHPLMTATEELQEQLEICNYQNQMELTRDFTACLLKLMQKRNHTTKS
jgi:hypothetical protein